MMITKERFIEKHIDLIENNAWQAFWYHAITDFDYSYELGQLIAMFDACDIDSKPDYIFQHIQDKPITIKWNQTDFITNEDIAHELNDELYKYRRVFRLNETDGAKVIDKLRELYLTNLTRNWRSIIPTQYISLTLTYNVEYQKPVLRISLSRGADFVIVGFQDILQTDLIIIPGEGWAYSEAGIKKMLDWFEYQLRNNLRIIQ